MFSLVYPPLSPASGCNISSLLQLVNSSWNGEMRDGYWLGQDNPGIYLGENQALNEDYTHSGFDRGHLNPNGHHAGMSTSSMD